MPLGEVCDRFLGVLLQCGMAWWAWRSQRNDTVVECDKRTGLVETLRESTERRGRRFKCTLRHLQQKVNP